jgi:hypothetical protein
MLEMASHVLVQMTVHYWTIEKTRHNSFWGMFTEGRSLGAKRFWYILYWLSYILKAQESSCFTPAVSLSLKC